MLLTVMIKGAYVFLLFLEELLLLYVIGVWFLPNSWLRQLLAEVVSPLLVPLQTLQRKSVIACRMDFSYVVAVLIVCFAKKFLENLM